MEVGPLDIQMMERWNNLSASEIRILKELVARIDSGEERVPIREVASSAYVSTTSIVRLAKKLGFDGFSELFYSLKYERVHSISLGMLGHCDRMLASRESVARLEQLASVLASRRYERIHIMGVGYSDLVARYFCDRLLENGFFAATKSPLDFRDDREYLIIFVSESGETKDLTFVQDRCSSRGVDDYVFTAEKSSTLGVNTERCILVERRGCRASRDPDYFVVNCLTLIEGLIARIRELQKEQEEER